MPEEIEIDTDSLREKIDVELEKRGGSFLRWISLTTAVLAALAAVASLKAGSTVNEALVLKTDATRLQAQASDQWAYYQAKGIKSAVAQSAINTWAAAGKPAPSNLSAESTRYVAQQDSISRKATELEHQRDEKSSEAEVLLAQHHIYAAAVALLQISIALGAIGALTGSRYVWFGSVGLGVVAAILLAIPMLRG
jgi:aminopeptidase N